jgi:hypothetical protein
MFTKGFDGFVCDDERITCEVDGFKVTARIEHDEDSGPPWDEDDGHGPVSDWTDRKKRPGERVLTTADRGVARRYYDFAEAVKIARKDGWGPPGSTDGMTPGQKAEAAAEHDFKVLRAWCRDDWWYVGIVLAVSRNDVTLGTHFASLWCVECNYPGSDNAYLTEVANQLLPEALDAARERLAKLCDCKAD